jgi:hypothetical protein
MKTRCRFHDLLNWNVYDSKIESVDGGLLQVTIAEHLDSENEAINLVFQYFKNRAIQRGIITSQEANNFQI